MNYLKSLLVEARAEITEAKKRAQKIVAIGAGVSLPLIKALLASASLLFGKELR